MKITLDIPDETICAFFNYVYYEDRDMFMNGYGMDKQEMYDGAVIDVMSSEKDGDT